MAQAHALTLRLPEPVYKAAKRLARIEGTSLNAVVVTAVTEKTRRSAARRLAAAYDELGRNDAEAQVESLLYAQVAAILND
jgi:hypothetical protein